ncbi:MAG: hypothetical protein U0350_39620 [Caldilineaceae bacterium]
MSSGNMGTGQTFDSPPSGAIRPTTPKEFEEEVTMPSGASESFAVPTVDADESAIMSMQSTLMGVDPNLVQIAKTIESQLLQQATAATSAAAMAAEAFEGIGNIQGVGFGLSEDTPSQVVEPGAAHLNVYVAEPVSVEQMKATLVDAMGISAASSDQVGINVIVTGLIEAQPHAFKARPAPGGVSLGHYQITAGTLGCLARGRTAPRNQRVLILSNNHVLANVNKGSYGDPILQPGPYDGGKNPQDRIAILERFVPINLSGAANYVDCSTAWAWHELVRPELVYRTGGVLNYFRVNSTTRTAMRGMLVGKSGRTTQLTTGRVVDVNFSGWVGYGSAGRAFFSDQMVVQGINGDFSRGGDSGSLIWTWDSQRNPVGLLFAGGGNITIANKIERVLNALDINLFT